MKIVIAPDSFKESLTALEAANAIEEGFKNDEEEIYFFHTIKPKILGKLIYYNKIYRIETGCPVNNGKMYHTYFTSRLQELKKEYQDME